jgi:hypothetical protein
VPPRLLLLELHRLLVVAQLLQPPTLALLFFPLEQRGLRVLLGLPFGPRQRLLVQLVLLLLVRPRVALVLAPGRVGGGGSGLGPRRRPLCLAGALLGDGQLRQLQACLADLVFFRALRRGRRRQRGEIRGAARLHRLAEGVADRRERRGGRRVPQRRRGGGLGRRERLGRRRAAGSLLEVHLPPQLHLEVADVALVLGHRAVVAHPDLLRHLRDEAHVVGHQHHAAGEGVDGLG